MAGGLMPPRRRKETEEHPDHELHIGRKLQGCRYVILWLCGERFEGTLLLSNREED